MRTAVIAWGSLVREPRQLQIQGNWQTDGPHLPVEYARISGRTAGLRRLTLVLKPGVQPVQTLFATSSYNTLNASIENLQEREGCSNERIGFIDFLNNRERIRTMPDEIRREITQWNLTRNFESVIWTDLPPNFSDITHTPFNIENVRRFLTSLSREEMNACRHYVEITPTQVQTALRQDIQAFFLL